MAGIIKHAYVVKIWAYKIGMHVCIKCVYTSRACSKSERTDHNCGGAAQFLSELRVSTHPTKALKSKATKWKISMKKRKIKSKSNSIFFPFLFLLSFRTPSHLFFPVAIPYFVPLNSFHLPISHYIASISTTLCHNYTFPTWMHKIKKTTLYAFFVRLLAQQSKKKWYIMTFH